MRHIGIDEAGRGPVLGPLVMAVVVIAPERERYLSDAGVRDSKLFGSGNKAHLARLALKPKIEEIALAFRVVEYAASTVDDFVEKRSLDDLERQGALRLLKEIGATTEDKIICDGEPMFKQLVSEWPNLLAENRADARHISVAAASILAKIRRDEAMHEILARYEPEFGKIAGGGYVNLATRKFLEQYEAAHGTLPLEVRKSWKWRQVSPYTVDIVSMFSGK